MIKYFNVPADFRSETIDKYEELNEKYTESKVIETYGQVTIDNYIGSGRAYDLLPQVDLEALEKYIAYSRERGIGFNYTLNSTCMGNMEFTREGILKIIRFLDELHSRHIRFALSNVLRSKGKENHILIRWLESRAGIYTAVPLNRSYSNSNYQTKDRTSASEEVLIINYPLG